MHFSAADRWIVNELQRVEAAVAQGFADFRLDNVAHAIYAFVWDEYCDWYLEIAKVQLAGGSAAAKRATRRTLLRVLEAVLRLLHPITPFITAELWEAVAPLAGRRDAAADAGIVLAPYPRADRSRIDASADVWMTRLKAAVGACRQLRSEMNLSPGERVPLLVAGDAGFVGEAAPLLQALARLAEVRALDDAAFDAATRTTPVAVRQDLRLALQVSIDVAAEHARLAKEIARLESEIGRASAKLDNPNFVERAPANVVAQERQRVDDFRQALGRLRDQASRLPSSS